MQVVVKMPHIRIDGAVTSGLIEFLKHEFGEIEIISDENEELLEVAESSWYKGMEGSIKPGENLRMYREIHGLTQEELGKKLGNFSRQNISNMENGSRAISKDTAKKLAALFNVSLERFL